MTSSSTRSSRSATAPTSSSAHPWSPERASSPASFRTAATKVRIFKMRKRKHYRKRQGHRQKFTEIQIGAVNPA